MEQNTPFITQEELTDCEVLVMKVIWQSDTVMSIQEIITRINQQYQKDWKLQRCQEGVSGNEAPRQVL